VLLDGDSCRIASLNACEVGTHDTPIAEQTPCPLPGADKSLQYSDSLVCSVNIAYESKSDKQAFLQLIVRLNI